jgi:hypothetical protein
VDPKGGHYLSLRLCAGEEVMNSKVQKIIQGHSPPWKFKTPTCQTYGIAWTTTHHSTVPHLYSTTHHSPLHRRGSGRGARAVRCILP